MAAPSVDFYGAHQAGIVTPAQDRLVFAAFDLTLSSADELRDLLREWSHAAAAMTRGDPAGREPASVDAPPYDTGEAVGLKPAQLTITFGFGPDVFKPGRLGLEGKRPHLLTPIGPLPRDQLDPNRSGGDLCVQACADDPQVAFHAVRNLARIGRGSVVLRWTQLGFGRTSSVTSDQVTARNLQGFKDGTNNLHGDDDEAMKRFVWLGADEPQRWMRGGTYLVARRIRMLIESWDRAALSDQQNDDRALQGERRATDGPQGARHGRPRRHRRGRDAGDPGRLPHPARRIRGEQRREDPAPRLLVHRRHRPEHGRARRRPLLRLRSSATRTSSSR